MLRNIFLFRDERFWLISIDLFLLFISLTFWFDLVDDGSFNLTFIVRNFLTLLISIIFYWLTGQYKNINKYVDSNTFYLIALRNLILVIVISELVVKQNITRFSIPIYLIEWIFITLTMTISRLFLRDIYKSYGRINYSLKKNISIYGAGSAGVLLARAIKDKGIYNIICFFDDSPRLWKRHINGIPILSPKELDKVSNKIEKIFLAIPSLTKEKTKKIFNEVNKFKIPILQIPSIQEITSQEKEVNALRPIELVDLLGREPVHPDPSLLQEAISGKNIFLSGAGGSIGKELAKQIIKLKPKSLIVFEISEPNLYELNIEIEDIDGINFPIISILGNICDEKLVNNVFQKYNIDSVFHAAAYKHVPIVEKNPIEGLFNNIFSTKILCQTSKKFNISNFILISTDKAVRPTNVMGLSKRISELIVQDYSRNSDGTIFSMVRFGNVLGSSGSVVPLFKKQIAQGGPITLTHPKVIRYFMSISEAAQLVIQTTQLAKGGEVFLLDMGDPVFISDLAVEMVKLSGLSVKDEFNPDGDIEIKVIGLRPGEKLFEELLINSESMPTSHPLIYRAVEDKVDSTFFNETLNQIIIYLGLKDIKNSLLLAKKLVPEWKNNE